MIQISLTEVKANFISIQKSRNSTYRKLSEKINDIV